LKIYFDLEFLHKTKKPQKPEDF